MELVNKATPFVIFQEPRLRQARTVSEILASLKYEWKGPLSPPLCQERTHSGFSNSFLADLWRLP